MEYLYFLIGIVCLILGLFISGITLKKRFDGTIFVYNDREEDPDLVLQIPDKSVLKKDVIQVKIIYITNNDLSQK